MRDMKKLTMFFAALVMMATTACTSAPVVEETSAEPTVADQPQSDMQFEPEQQASEPVISDSSSSLGAASSGRGH